MVISMISTRSNSDCNYSITLFIGIPHYFFHQPNSVNGYS